MWLRIGSTPKPPSRGRPAKSDDASVEACGPVRVCPAASTVLSKVKAASTCCSRPFAGSGWNSAW